MKPDPFLKAVDDEYSDLIRAAMQIYNERMKPSRKRLSLARAALLRAEQNMAIAERRHSAELEENRAEAARWRDDQKRAVRSVRPTRLSDVEAVTRVTTREQAAVSLPRVKCLEAPIENSERGSPSRMNAPFPVPGLLPGELAVDSFAGGGGTSEGIRQALGRDPDIAINHDALALAMHRMNHPGTHHMVEDVWHVDALGMCDGRPIGLLWLSPDCFPAGTLVLTEDGYRPIEVIKVGDRVLTHEQRWRRVTETSSAFRPLITLRGHGHPGLTMSPEHPIFARQRRDTWCTHPRGYVRSLDPADWMPAAALGQGWYWATPTRFPLDRDIPAVGGRGMPFDQRLMWLVGRYLGDGWTRLTADRAELVITCGRHEVEGLLDKLSVWERHGDRATSGELAWHGRETATAYQFTTNHRGLVEWLREHFGHGAESKRLPAWALGMPGGMREALLTGYLSADGWRHDHFYEARTVSKALAFSVKSLVTSLGGTATVHLLQNSTLIEGRTVIARPIYLLRWRHALDPKHAQTFRQSDGYEWAPIREQVELEESAEVFNIGVEEDESYVVEGIIVHNCKHFSKAKGGKPRDKAIRGLAWVGLRWVKSLPKRQRPRIVILENVEEFQFWGPLLDDGSPCPVQKGATFKSFIGGFEALGYVAEWRELRACDYGDPTIRKRLFVILRRDKLPIVWPPRTHGNPKDAEDAKLIAAGHLLPWRTAAEIIDFSLPCPSIFETRAEIKASLGIRAIRPLADNTMARVAKGTMRYVVNAARPFIVPVTHCGDARANSIDEPLRTITTARRGEHALVTPFVTKFNRGAVGHALDEPLATVTSHASDTHGGGAAPLGLVAPHLMTMRNAEKPFTAIDEPVHTITASGAGMTVVAPILVGCGGRVGQSEPRPADEPVLTQTAKADACIVAPFLVPRYQEKPGHDPRTRSVELPTATVMPRGNEGVLASVSLAPHEEVAPIAAVHLSRQFGASVGSAADEPAGTVTAGGGGKTALVAAFLAQHNGDRAPKPGRAVEDPISTITATGGQSAVVAAFMAQHNTGEIGHDIGEPVSTIVSKGCTQGLVQASFLSHAYSSNTAAGAGAIDAPLKTETAGGQHAARVAVFMAKYYGSGEPSQAVDDPMHTLTTKPRHGLVTVTIDGEPFVITDIGMRMLTPRERFSAQGFRPDYVIDRGLLEDGSTIALTLEQQGRMCGNSVCPGMARALVAANTAVRPVQRRARPERAYPLLQAAE